VRASLKHGSAFFIRHSRRAAFGRPGAGLVDGPKARAALEAQARGLAPVT
jgi:hypothetical protein